MHLPTLAGHREYMASMFNAMTIEDVKKYRCFIEALYETEAYLVEEELRYAAILEENSVENEIEKNS